MDVDASPVDAGLKLEQAAHHRVLEDYIAAVEAATARRDRLKLISRRRCTWSLLRWCAPALHEMGLVAAATVIAELGDITRFANPRQLMACLGLVPSERSSGATPRQGGLTKADQGGATNADRGGLGLSVSCAHLGSNCCARRVWQSGSAIARGRGRSGGAIASSPERENHPLWSRLRLLEN